MAMRQAMSLLRFTSTRSWLRAPLQPAPRTITLGVPFDLVKGDYVLFNAHRVYGKTRYPYLATNWEQAGAPCVQRLSHGQLPASASSSA